MLDKTMLRQALLAKRQSISPDVRHQWDIAIGERILAWFAYRPVQLLGVYWPIQGEADLRWCYEILSRHGIHLALPNVVKRNTPLQFLSWIPGEPLTMDVFGTAIPSRIDTPVYPEALLVPCVGFANGNIRLGYGGGFYDRTLAVTPRPFTLGIAYECSFALFDQAPHDIALDRIITEQTPLPFNAD